MHNKFERLALVRLRLSMKEILGDLPEDVEAVYSEVTAPDSELRERLFVPTRPGILEAGKEIAVTAVAPGSREAIEAEIGIRMENETSWIFRPMTVRGRRTFEGLYRAGRPECELL